MFSHFCKGINTKRFVMAMAAVFAFIFVAEWVIHGQLLKGIYMDTASLWRPEAEMKDYCIWMFVGYFLMAKYFTFIFARGCETSGVAEGFRFGVLMGIFMASGCFMWYAVMPIPQTLLWSWVGSALFEGIVAGMIAGAIYKKA